MALAPRLRSAAVLLGLIAPLVAVGGAGAQTPPLPTAEGAQALEAQLRGWLARQVGPALDTGPLPLRVVVDGDNYRLEVPFGGSFFNDMLTLADGAVSATVKPLDGGRWAIVNAGIPSRIRADMRHAGAPTSLLLGIEKHETSGVFDPSLATASTLNTVITGYSTEMPTPAGVQASHFDKLSGRSEWQPTGPGRVTLTGHSTVEKYSSASPLPDGGAMQVSIERMGGTTRLENVDLEGVGSVLRTAFTLAAASQPVPTGETRKSPKPDEKAIARELLGQVFGLLDAVAAEYTYDGVKIEGGSPLSGSLRHASLGFALAAPGGRSEVKLRLALEGLDSPMIPDGVWRDYLPQRVALSPRVAGIPKEALMGFLRRAIDTDGDSFGSEAVQLLAAGPLVLAIDDLLIDLGPLRLKGEGTMKVASLDDATGEAELRATGIDAMIRRANTTRELKMAAPALIFLKGIGRQDGTETVWKITYIDRKVMVNDTDLSDMMPSK